MSAGSKRKADSYNEVAAFAKISLKETFLKRLESPAAYTDEVLRDRLKYVRDCLQEQEASSGRQFSVRTIGQLNIYHRTVVMSLNTDQERIKEDCIATLMDQEKFFEDNDSVLERLTEEQAEMEQKIIELQRLQYFARYADYFNHTLTKIKKTANRWVEDAHLLRRYWTDIASIIKLQKSVLEADPQTTADVSTWKAVISTCQMIKKDPQIIYTCIMAYAERNESMHGTIDEMIQKEDWNGLAVTLVQDDLDVAAMAPAGRAEEVIALRSCIHTIRDLYFVVYPGTEHAPMAWDRTLLVKQLATKVKVELNTKEEALVRASARAVETNESTKKRLRILWKFGDALLKAEDEFAAISKAEIKRIRADASEMDKAMNEQALSQDLADSAARRLHNLYEESRRYSLRQSEIDEAAIYCRVEEVESDTEMIKGKGENENFSGLDGQE